MLGLDHRILLEDDQGKKHALQLLEIVEERYFVLLPPDQAVRLIALQAAGADGLDEALTILIDSVSVVSMRDHGFLPEPEVVNILGRSRHHILRLAGLRFQDDLPPCVEPAEAFSHRSFADECDRREGW